MTQQRTNQLQAWVQRHRTIHDMVIIPGDASTRRYFRLSTEQGSLIAVDAPTIAENTVAFVELARSLAAQGLQVPIVHEVDYEQGFMLLSDLGDQQLLAVLRDPNVHHYYHAAMNDLVKLQACQNIKNYSLPRYDHTLLTEELNRFHEWYLEKYLGIALNTAEWSLLDKTYNFLIEMAMRQPYVLTHRDYHSRNLMVLPDDTLAIIDFQDAVLGPISYDLVSLLRDCYVNWCPIKVYSWVDDFWHLLPQAYQHKITQQELRVGFDLIGLQRHLKVLGTFARLCVRDNRSNYMADVPRILNYILYVCDQYPKLTDFNNFLTTRVVSHEGNDISSRQGEPTAAIDR